MANSKLIKVSESFWRKIKKWQDKSTKGHKVKATPMGKELENRWDYYEGLDKTYKPNNF